jgi:predicted Zn-dependent protease
VSRDFSLNLLEVWFSPSTEWYHAPSTHEEASMDLDAFRQMVTKNPKGFLGRYGLGNKLIQEGGNLEEAVEHLTVATQLDPTHVASHLHLGRTLISLGRKTEAKPILQAGIDAAQSGRSNGGGDLVPEMQTLLQTLG